MIVKARDEVRKFAISIHPIIVAATTLTDIASVKSFTKYRSCQNRIIQFTIHASPTSDFPTRRVASSQRREISSISHLLKTLIRTYGSQRYKVRRTNLATAPQEITSLGKWSEKQSHQQTMSRKKRMQASWRLDFFRLFPVFQASIIPIDRLKYERIRGPLGYR